MADSWTCLDEGASHPNDECLVCDTAGKMSPLKISASDLSRSFDIYYGDTFYYKLPVKTTIEHLRLLHQPDQGLTISKEDGLVVYRCGHQLNSILLNTHNQGSV